MGAEGEVQLSSTVGIVANPASARDVRRIVAHGGAVTTHDKLNRLHRVMSGLSATGVKRVISMADRAGVMAGLAAMSERPSAADWPVLEFVEQPVTHTATDTTIATQAMVNAGVGSIVVLGGDGTNRLVGAESGDTPIVSLSTGTNNAFPQPVEATVAGIAAGLVATDHGCRSAGTYRAKKLTVRTGDRFEEALVDIAITSGDAVGSGALWDLVELTELFLCFAEPGSIGLSAIGGHIKPTPRHSSTGLHLVVSAEAVTTVLAPIAPGLISTLGVESVSPLEPDAPVTARTQSGVIAIDGERMVRFGPKNKPTVTLRPKGLIAVDVAKTIDHAARSGLLTRRHRNQLPGRQSAKDSTEQIQDNKQKPEPWEVST